MSQGNEKSGGNGKELNVDKLWRFYTQTRSDTYRNLLMEHYCYLVRSAAKSIHAKLPVSFDLNDLISAGTFGLMDAIYSHNPSRGVKFKTYCELRIKGAILDELRNMDWVPILLRTRAHQFSKAQRSLEMTLGRKPDDTELMQELDMGEEEYRRLKKDSKAAVLISLETRISSGHDGENLYIKDTLRDPNSKNQLLEVQKRELKNMLLEGLTRAEKLVVSLYYYEQMTQKEIGAALGLHESRISQMHSAIIERLKARLKPEHLE